MSQGLARFDPWRFLQSEAGRSFAARIRGAFGEAGAAWIERLPSVLDEAALRSGLRILPPFPHMLFNFVAPAVDAGGGRVVVKAGVPRPQLLHEIVALQVYDGRGAVRVIDAWAEHGIFLLEWLEPGVPILEMADDVAATAICAGIVRELTEAGHAYELPVWVGSFPTVAEWSQGLDRLRARFDGGTGPLPSELVTLAERLYAELLSSEEGAVLLHGDLHHVNILSAERAPWLAIDPQGVLGEPAYEVGAWLRNPFEELLRMADPVRVTRRRIDQFRDLLGLDRERVWGWAVAQTVLSAVWDLEDGDPVWSTAWVSVAEMLSVARPG